MLGTSALSLGSHGCTRYQIPPTDKETINRRPQPADRLKFKISNSEFQTRT